MFKSISENVRGEIVEKKSKFIANLYYIESEEEADALIKQVNKTYFDAKHHCYAYRVMTKNGIISRFSDDGEPSRTAGGPMLNILTSQNLSNILAIVTRYFGGILLGTGGLVKAYSLAVMEALNQANLVEKELGREVKIIVKYEDLEKLKYFFRQNKINIVKSEYGENIEIIAEMTQEKYETMLQHTENFNGLKCELMGEKFIGR